MTNERVKICIFTLGCKVNLYDSDAMLAVFKQAGFDVAEGIEFADAYVINTCAVTAEAEKKSRQSVARVKKVNPNAKIYVCGCASQRDSVQFVKDGVRYIGGTEGKLKLAHEIVDELKGIKSVDAANFAISDKYEDSEGIVNLRTRHFIKVQDGCNNFCSYCIIPYLRGRSRSRSIDSIKAELDSVADSINEVVVTGINLTAYGKDFGGSLVQLVDALADYDFRIRLGSVEASVIDRDFLDSTKRLKAFCPHFHLSLQSGDGEVLRAMNRRYTPEQYAAKVELIREYYPLAGVTTDIIVGFPTETEGQFENSANFAKQIAFSDIHVFPYSSRKGTVAGKLKPIAPEVMDERVKRMSAVKQQLIADFLKKNVGTQQEVLFETCEDGEWVGHTRNYIKVYSERGARNSLATIVPDRLFKDGLKG